MGRKQEYKETNLEFLKELSSQEGVYALPCGIYYKVLETGTGTVFPNVRSIVTVHYKGSLINGRVFDNSYERNCPEASASAMYRWLATGAPTDACGR